MLFALIIFLKRGNFSEIETNEGRWSNEVFVFVIGFVLEKLNGRIFERFFNKSKILMLRVVMSFLAGLGQKWNVVSVGRDRGLF